MKFRKFFQDIAIGPSLLKQVRNWPAFLIDHFGFQRQPYLIELRNGLSIEVRPGTTDKGALVEVFLLGNYRAASQFIASAETIIDIGAHIGSFTLYAHKANPRAKIFSFEACAANFALLRKNIERNQAANARLQHAAVVSESREVKLFTAGNQTGSNSLYHPTQQFELVQGLGINELFASLKIDRCDLLKMDCEGAETEILRSITPQNLAAVRAIIMEYHDPSTIPEMEAILKKSGFQVTTWRGAEWLMVAHRP
jgi:FkbM family methyltransferase